MNENEPKGASAPVPKAVTPGNTVPEGMTTNPEYKTADRSAYTVTKQLSGTFRGRIFNGNVGDTVYLNDREAQIYQHSVRKV